MVHATLGNSSEALENYFTSLKILKEKANQTSEEIVNTTIHSLEKFRGLKEPNDDITLVVLKIL